MANLIVGLVLVVFLFFAVRKTVGLMHGGCCGGGGPAPKRVKVQDKNPENYALDLDLEVKGMMCGHCAIRVENALNGLEGAWAQVDLDKNKAELRLKKEIPEETIRQAVHDAGYTVGKIKAHK